ncbi:MAG: carbamoyl-phosphate synthase large subunit, partial [Opitutales bacterium]
KATGFPIAKIAAKLAVGYTLDELRNDITRETPASFEPTIDYVVTKIPRFTFEKFVGAKTILNSSMKSVGEAMAIGRTFKESLQKALRSLEIGSRGLGGGGFLGGDAPEDTTQLRKGLGEATLERIFYVRYAFLAGMTREEVYRFTKIDPWFLEQIAEIVRLEQQLKATRLSEVTPDLLREAKESGFTDAQIAEFLNTKIRNVKRLREEFGIPTVYRLVDTCAAEFEAYTPYYYSTYGDENELRSSDKQKIMIIGGGPNRIGQGIEFDYCCVHASFVLRERGYETVMVNSNPETVSTDYDTSDRLFFEPLTLEDVLEVYQQEGCSGAIVQFGGQTPLNLATQLQDNGVNIIGTRPEMIDAAEDREQFKDILDRVGLRQPVNAIAHSPEQAYERAGEIGFPLLLRPGFVLGGRGMFIVYDIEEMKRVIQQAFEVAPGHGVLLDKFLEDAIELDVDAVSDGETTVIGGMLEHIEFAGVHSGDAAMVLPPHTLDREMLDRVAESTRALARELEVVGLMNVQYAIKGGDLYVLEVNPRASRTVPFISKAIGHPLAKYAARVMAGETLAQVGFTQEITPHFWAVKEAVFPFVRFPGAPVALSPEMRSTGEVMGIDFNLGVAVAKSQMAAQPALPDAGNVFISVRDGDKARAVEFGQSLYELGFQLYSTSGTARALEGAGLPVNRLFKVSEGARPNILDMMKNGEIQLIINTPSGQIPRHDENQMRQEAYARKICIMTTMAFAEGAISGIRAMREIPLAVRSLQEYARELP